MTALVTAAGGIEPPREVDADATRIVVLAELSTDIDAAIGRHLRVLRMQDVVGKQGHAQTLVFEELLGETEVDEACCLYLGTA